MNTVSFVIPLISKFVANDWELTSRLCLRTLRSLLNQSDPNWSAVVIGDEIPLFWPHDPRITFISEALPIPSTSAEKHLDQKLKVKRGMI